MSWTIGQEECVGMSKKVTLVIEPHSDDSLIAAGGYFLKYKDELDLHFCLIAASDLQLHHGFVSRQTRIDEYERYVNVVGGKWIRPEVNGEQLPLDKEARLDTVNRSFLVKFCENVIHSLRPELLMIMGPSFHHDHTIVYEAVIAATRPTFSYTPQTIYLMENPTYVHQPYPMDFSPNLYVEMTEDLVQRKVAIFNKVFASQIRSKHNYLSDETLMRWARYRGLEARCDFAEAFRQYYARI